MEDLIEILSNNIVQLRKKHGLTQSQLAEKLNYSDKAVSKWERGESAPDIFIIKKLSDIFGVSVDTMLKVNASKRVRFTKKLSLSRTITAILGCLCVWLIATIAFVVLTLCGVPRSWLAFIVALPISLIVAIVFSSVWGAKWQLFTAISIFIWTFFGAFYISIIAIDLWLIFLIGVPLQLGVILWSILDAFHTKRKALE